MHSSPSGGHGRWSTASNNSSHYHDHHDRPYPRVSHPETHYGHAAARFSGSDPSPRSVAGGDVAGRKAFAGRGSEFFNSDRHTSRVQQEADAQERARSRAAWPSGVAEAVDSVGVHVRVALGSAAEVTTSLLSEIEQLLSRDAAVRGAMTAVLERTHGTAKGLSAFANEDPSTSGGLVPMLQRAVTLLKGIASACIFTTTEEPLLRSSSRRQHRGGRNTAAATDDDDSHDSNDDDEEDGATQQDHGAAAPSSSSALQQQQQAILGDFTSSLQRLSDGIDLMVLQFVADHRATVADAITTLVSKVVSIYNGPGNLALSRRPTLTSHERDRLRQRARGLCLDFQSVFIEVTSVLDVSGDVYGRCASALRDAITAVDTESQRLASVTSPRQHPSHHQSSSAHHGGQGPRGGENQASRPFPNGYHRYYAEDQAERLREARRQTVHRQQLPSSASSFAGQKRTFSDDSVCEVERPARPPQPRAEAQHHARMAPPAALRPTPLPEHPRPSVETVLSGRSSSSNHHRPPSRTPLDHAEVDLAMDSEEGFEGVDKSGLASPREEESPPRNHLFNLFGLLE